MGRTADFGTVLARVEAGHATLLRGIAGVGKTRLAREVADHLARRAGWEVVSRHATRTLQELPLGLLSDLIEAGPGRSNAGEAIADAYRFLTARLPTGRALLVVDDADLVDHASAVVLQRIIENRAAAVLLTCRSGRDLPDGLTAVTRADAVTVLTVDALGPPDARTLAEAAAGTELAAELLDDICTRTGGVPLFVLALVRDRTLGPEQRRASSLAEAVQATLGRPQPDDLDALEVIALGEPIELAVAERLCRDESLERLERSGLIEVDLDGRRRTVRTAHPLYAETITAGMGELRRRRLLRLLAADIEAMAGRRDDQLRIVLWRLAAGDPVAPAAIVVAAQQAVARGGLALAERLLREHVSATASAEASYILAGICLEQGRPAEAVELCAAAPDTDDDAARARLAVTWSIALFVYLGEVEAARQVLARFRAMVAAPWRLELDYFEITLRFYTGEVGTAVRLVDAFLAEPELTERSRVWFMLPGLMALATSGRTSEALAHAQHARSVAAQFADEIVSIVAHATCVWAYASVYHGHIAGCAEVVAERQAAAAAGEDRASEGFLSVIQGVLAMHGARFDEAAELLDVSIEQATGWALAARAWRVEALVLAGRRRDARQLLETLAVVPQFSFHHALNRTAAGEVALAFGHRDEAIAAFDDAAAHALTEEQHTFVALARFRSFAAGPSDDRAAALAEAAGRLDGPLGRALATAAAAWSAQDPKPIERARKTLERSGSTLSALQFGDLIAELLEHRRPGSPDAARARSRAANRWIKAGARRAAADGEPDDPPGAPMPPAATLRVSTEALTPRERDVVGRAAAGLSDNAIADALQISPRTVHAHLRSAYRKLGISGRNEL